MFVGHSIESTQNVMQSSGFSGALPNLIRPGKNKTAKTVTFWRFYYLNRNVICLLSILRQSARIP